MKSISEVRTETGLSIDTLRYYEKEKLVMPFHGRNGYREYSEDDIDRIRQITFYRALDFSISQIKEVFNDPQYDRTKVLNEQISLLKDKIEHLENMIEVAENMRDSGRKYVPLGGYGFATIDECAQLLRQIKSSDAFAELEKRLAEFSSEHADEEETIFNSISQLADHDPNEDAVQKQIEILAMFYTREFKYGVYLLFCLWSEYSESDLIRKYVDGLVGPTKAVFFLKSVAIYLEQFVSTICEEPFEKLYDAFSANMPYKEVMLYAEPLVEFWNSYMALVPMSYLLDMFERIISKSKYDDAESQEMVSFFIYVIDVLRLFDELK